MQSAPIATKVMSSNPIHGAGCAHLKYDSLDHRFEPWSGQTKDYATGICGIAAKNATCKSKDWLTRNQDNVSEWSNMSTCSLLFQLTSTIKIQLSVYVMN